MKSQSNLTNSDKSNSDHVFQGRSKKHVESNNRVAWIAVVILASIIALMLISDKCKAQTELIGYRWCISDSAGFRCDNTTQLQVALDTIIPVCGTPEPVILACLQESPYYLSETEVFSAYIEAKRIVGYKRNGKPRLRRL